MAKVEGGAAGARRPIASRGAFYMRRTEKFGVIAEAWPRKRPGPGTLNQQRARLQFAQAAQLAARPTGPTLDWLKRNTLGSNITWRDLFMALIYGRVFEGYSTSGTYYRSTRQVATQTQLDLNTITPTPGSMLIRGPTDWLGLNPQANGSLLTMDLGLPAWKAPADITGTWLPLAGGTLTGDLIIQPPAGNVHFQLIANDYTICSTTSYRDSQLSTLWRTYKARGTDTAPEDVTENDSVWTIQCNGWAGGNWQRAANLQFSITEPVPSATALGCEVQFSVNKIGTTDKTLAFTVNADTGPQGCTQEPIQNANGYPILSLRTQAQMATETQQGACALITDSSRGARPAYYDGGFWRFFSDDAIVS